MIGVNTGMLRQFARGLPLVRDLHGVLMNLDGRLASLERRCEQTQSLPNPSQEYMDRALAVVSEFWRGYDFQIETNKPPILVDLLHCNAEYLWRNLVVAKFVQHITGAPLVGLVGQPGIITPVLGPLLSRTDNARMASAFGISHFVEIPNDTPGDAQELTTRSAIAELASSQPDGTRLPPTAIARLLELRTESGFPIGRTIQDTFMRGELEPTVLAGHRLVHWAHQVLGFLSFAEPLIASTRPLAFVTGHVDYCPWGTLAELLVRHGGRVVWYRMECRLPIHILHHVDPTTTLNGMIRRIERVAFSEFERQVERNSNLAARIDALAQARSAAVRKGVGRHCRWVAVNPLVSPAAARVPSLDRDLPNYCLFTHTFTDQPAADEALFVDHLQWVEETCRHAAATRAYNLIIKIHPLDRDYDRSAAADRLAAEFADAPNIHFTREHIEPAELARNCALGLTVRGTPGLEMTAAGLPMMLAGRGPYSDTGICMAPRTRTEYFDLLTKGPPFPIDIATQSRRAQRYMAFDRHWSAPMTELVPAFGCRTASDPSLWTLIVDGFHSACLETDQVARAIARACSKGSAKVVAPEVDELFAIEARSNQVA